MRLGGLDHHDRPRVFLLSTTHGAETHALAAAIATMQVYQREGVIEHLYRQGTRLRQLAEEAIRRHGLTEFVQILGRPCCLSYATLDQDGQPSQAFRIVVPARDDPAWRSHAVARGQLFPHRRGHRPHGSGDRRSARRSIGGRSTMVSIAIWSAGRLRRFTGATIIPRNLPGYGAFPWQPMAVAIRGRRPMAA